MPLHGMLCAFSHAVRVRMSNLIRGAPAWEFSRSLTHPFAPPCYKHPPSWLYLPRGSRFNALILYATHHVIIRLILRSSNLTFPLRKMDRSTTPRPALAERGQHSDLLPRRPVSMAMLRKNRSRSGSEELQQITAQHPKNTSGDHPSRPESVTPTPNVYYRSNVNGTHQTLNESAGLLGWMRSTFMSGPSGRNLDVHFEGHDDENPVASIVDRKLNATPLLPGILPLFHRGEHHEDAPLAEGVVIDSARSSFEGLTSEGHDSLETYSYSFDKRRTSQVSNATTVYDDEKDISDQSDVDHAYTPYSNPNATNSTPLVRPTARREALGFASADEVRGNKASSQSGPSYTDRESLSMSEGKLYHQYCRWNR